MYFPHPFYGQHHKYTNRFEDDDGQVTIVKL